MPDEILEKYLKDHIEASTDEVISFSWHGGEPLLAGLSFYRKVVDIQKKYKPAGRMIRNGIQTNGTLLNDEWCRFLSSENFSVGISIDGPAGLNDSMRVSVSGKPVYDMAIHGFEILKKYNIPSEILCVVHDCNVAEPLVVYDHFRKLGARYITFLPLVVNESVCNTGTEKKSVRPEAFGTFLCTVFDEWVGKDIGTVKIQIIEEALRTAFNQDHTLCIFRKYCGGVPVVELNGEFYSCDHYVDNEHYIGSIRERSLISLLEDPRQVAFGKAKSLTLPHYCLECEVLEMCNGECPRNRFISTPDGEPGLNYLCKGYKMFFNHIRPFATAVSEAWKSREET